MRAKIFEVDMDACRKALEKAKEFCERVSKKKKVYLVSGNGLCCTTMKWWADEFARMNAVDIKPERAEKPEGVDVDLSKVLQLFYDGMKFKDIAKAINTTQYHLRKVCMANDVDLSTQARLENRNQKIRDLSRKGKTPEEIKKILELNICEKTIKEICCKT